jgi:polysaccharide pyruvyl transferase WcaK-like protein
VHGKSKKMNFNILVIGDNRDSKNWGCRSTSIALTQILSQVGNIDVLPRSIVSKEHPIGFLNSRVPNKKLFQKALTRTVRIRPVQASHKLMGGKLDYITDNPKNSVYLFRKEVKKGNGSLERLWKKFEESDIIVINGEGSLIFRTPPRRDLNFMLFAIELASQIGKPVYFVNAMASDCPISRKNLEVEKSVFDTLPKCQSVLVRDPLSEKRLKELGLQEIEYCPDALFSWADRYGGFLYSNLPKKYPELFDCWPESDRFRSGWLDFPSDYICISGGSRPPGVDTSKWGSIFTTIVSKIQEKTGLGTVLIDPDGDSFLEKVSYETNSIFIRPQTHILLGLYVLANAKAYVSGRYHPSILASLGGTPCTFMVSNSHKTRSLQNVLGYEKVNEFSITGSEKNLHGILQDLECKLNKGGQIRDQIKAKSSQHSNTVVSKILNAIS